MSDLHPGQVMVGCDFDGTLVTYDGWKGQSHIGTNVGPMVERIKEHLKQGHDVWIFTARYGYPKDRKFVFTMLNQWSLETFGQILPITADKSGFDIIYDDRAQQVIPNTGKTVKEAALEIIDEEMRNFSNSYFGNNYGLSCLGRIKQAINKL